MITECNLNLAPALARCKAAYGKSLTCEQVEYGAGELNKAPFVTPKCPPGYQRYGCCKCVRKCNYTDSIAADVAAGEDVQTSEPGPKSTTVSKDQLSDLKSKDLMVKKDRKLV